MTVNVPYIPGQGMEATPKPNTVTDWSVLPVDTMAGSNHVPAKWLVDPRETAKKAQSKS